MARTSPPTVLNALIQMLYLPCTGNGVQVWVKTAKPAALKLFWTAVQPNAKQLIRTVEGKSWLHYFRAAAQDVVEESPYFTFQDTEFLFQIAEVVDPITLYMWLGEITGNFLVNWTSLAYRMEGCGPDNQEQIGVLPIGTCNSSDTGGWQGIGAWYYPYPPPGIRAGASIFVPKGTSGTLYGSAAFVPYFGEPFGVDTRVVCQEDGTIPWTTNGAQNNTYGGMNWADLPEAGYDRNYTFEGYGVASSVPRIMALAGGAIGYTKSKQPYYLPQGIGD